VRALGTGDMDGDGEDVPVGAASTRRIVLPRILRGPVRRLARLEWRVPKHAGIKGLAALYLSTAVAGVIVGGHGLTIASAVTTWSGLAIEKVEITGQSETSEVDVLAGLGIGDYPSIVTFDVDAARARIEALPWVEQATIRKLYPDTLNVRVAERSAYAIWQHEGQFSLIDKAGRSITEQIGERYAKLPLVVGDGAEKRAGEFVSIVDGVPSLKPLIKAGVLVSNRRWNVLLTNGVEILLPQDDPGSALVQVVALNDGHAILSRDITAIDLRLPDRLVVRLTEAGEAARQQMLKDRDKAGKKGAA